MKRVVRFCASASLALAFASYLFAQNSVCVSVLPRCQSGKKVCAIHDHCRNSHPFSGQKSLFVALGKTLDVFKYDDSKLCVCHFMHSPAPSSRPMKNITATNFGYRLEGLKPVLENYAPSSSIRLGAVKRNKWISKI